jgi:hypothetical protein
MAEPDDMILPLLREMRAENAAQHEQTRGEMREKFAIVDRRLDKLETTLEGYRHALSADSLLSKLVTGEFEERIELLERKVRELEGLK